MRQDFFSGAGEDTGGTAAAVHSIEERNARAVPEAFPIFHPPNFRQPPRDSNKPVNGWWQATRRFYRAQDGSTPYMSPIFLIHNSGDAPLVSLLVSMLSPQGIRSFVAEDQLRPGGLVVDKVKEAIDASSIMVALFTKDGNASGAVNQEVGYAIKAGKTVIPLVEKGVQPTLFMYGVDPIEYDSADPSPALVRCVKVLNDLQAEKEEKLRQAMEARRRSELKALGVAFGIGFLITSAIFAAIVRRIPPVSSR